MKLLQTSPSQRQNVTGSTKQERVTISGWVFSIHACTNVPLNVYGKLIRKNKEPKCALRMADYRNTLPSLLRTKYPSQTLQKSSQTGCFFIPKHRFEVACVEEVLGDLRLDRDEDGDVRHLLEKMSDQSLVLPYSESKTMQEDDRIWTF